MATKNNPTRLFDFFSGLSNTCNRNENQVECIFFLTKRKEEKKTIEMPCSLNLGYVEARNQDDWRHKQHTDTHTHTKFNKMKRRCQKEREKLSNFHNYVYILHSCVFRSCTVHLVFCWKAITITNQVGRMLADQIVCMFAEHRAKC